MSKSKVCNEKYAYYCFFCGKPVGGAEHHLVFGRGLRQLAEEDGLKVPICNDCHTTGRVINRIHDNPMAERLSKVCGQAFFERNYISERGCSIDEAREAFRRRYGKCYY
jgi:hypothetical protein